MTMGECTNGKWCQYYIISEFECLVIITDDTRLVSGDNIKRLSLVRDELSKEKKKIRNPTMDRGSDEVVLTDIVV